MEKYEIILKQIIGLLSKDDYFITTLANASSFLFHELDNVSWVGFYLLDNDNLILGPFQGKVACTNIKVGKGVCGTTIQRRESIVVEDVDLFHGHIACDSASKSEICVPLFIDRKIIGLLDIDAPIKNRFSENDKYYLEKVCKIIEEKLNLKSYALIP